MFGTTALQDYLTFLLSFVACMAMVYLGIDLAFELNASARKVGGITFVRLGRLRLSFCVARPVVA
jgi:hypothetical protein